MSTAYRTLLAAFACTMLVSSASAQANLADPNLSCGDYLKAFASAAGSAKTGDAAMDKMAAEIDKKMNDYCKANPNAKAMEAAAKAMGG